jgi:hypothetical protein
MQFMARPARQAKPAITRYSMRRKAKAQRASLHPLDAMGPALTREDSPAEKGEVRANGLREYRTTRLGKIFLGNSLELLRGRIADSSVDLMIVSSDPFLLLLGTTSYLSSVLTT